MFDVFDKNGQIIKCRALLDSGSQSNFVTKSFFMKLNLEPFNINIPTSGISQNLVNITKKATIKFKSPHGNYSSQLQFLIINQITGVTPQRTISEAELKIPTGISLAEPNFNIPSNIDMLLGAEVFFEFLGTNKINLGRQAHILHETKLGWVISGPILTPDIEPPACFLAINSLESELQRFWQVEEGYSDTKVLTKEELECESHFSLTVKRYHGRFVVTLPLKPNYTELGDSLDPAMKRFYTIERKLSKNPELKTQYTNFMLEYQNLGHMTKVDSKLHTEYPTYYIPHHSVEKRDSITTKLRVVFDASTKTTSNISLNDVLNIGPTIQNDLFSIIIRFRKHNLVLTSDIAKMYRQINIIESQRSLHYLARRTRC